MGPLGWQETVAIFVLALLIFGPKKLPELGKNLAKALGEFRRASGELKDTWHREMNSIERETQGIRDEATKLAGMADPTPYNYDSSYDYSSYGYPDSNYDSTSPTDSSTPSDSTATATTESASAVTGADSTAADLGDAVPDAPKISAAEGTVPADPGPAAATR